MVLTIFSDELRLDIEQAIPVIDSWGLKHVDLRGKVYGSHFQEASPDQLKRLAEFLRQKSMRVACLESSLAKFSRPEEAEIKDEHRKLEAVIRAADILQCRLVRSYHFFRPNCGADPKFQVDPKVLDAALELFRPLAEEAEKAGLDFVFENCGVSHEDVFLFLDGLGVPAWRMAWDVFNTWDCSERRGNQKAFIRRMAGRAGLIHVKAEGAVDGYGPEPIPWSDVLRGISEVGFTGPVSVETHNPDDRLSHIDLSKAVVKRIQKDWPRE